MRRPLINSKCSDYHPSAILTLVAIKKTVNMLPAHYILLQLPSLLHRPIPPLDVSYSRLVPSSIRLVRARGIRQDSSKNHCNQVQDGLPMVQQLLAVRHHHQLYVKVKPIAICIPNGLQQLHHLSQKISRKIFHPSVCYPSHPELARLRRRVLRDPFGEL